MTLARQHQAAVVTRLPRTLRGRGRAVGAAGQMNVWRETAVAQYAARALGGPDVNAERCRFHFGRLQPATLQTSRTGVVSNRRSARQRDRNAREAPTPSQDSERRGRVEQSAGRGLRLSAFQTSRRRLSAAFGGSLDTSDGGLASGCGRDRCGGDVAMGLKGAVPSNPARSLTGQRALLAMPPAAAIFSWLLSPPESTGTPNGTRCPLFYNKVTHE